MRMDKILETGTRSWTHMLLIGQSKVGKTHWIAQAAIDGYELLYLDKDNGMETIQRILKSKPDALARVHYMSPDDPLEFLADLFGKPRIRWNERTNAAYTLADVQSDDDITEIVPARMVNRNVVLVIDSWTAIVNFAMDKQLTKENKDALDIDKIGREIYGGVNLRLTMLLAAIQNLPIDIVVLAHSDLYEKREKPKNVKVGEMQEKDFRILGTYEVPISSSRPHGETLPKYFSSVGWLTMNLAGVRKLSFKGSPTRVAGGATNGEDDADGAYRFAKLWPLRPEPKDAAPWIRYTTAAEVEAERKDTKSSAPTLPNKSQSAANPLANAIKKS